MTTALPPSAVLIEPQYLPPAAYFAVALKYGTVILEKHEHFVKQTLRNRALINTAHGTARLVVPVKSGKAPMGEVQIDYSQKWVNNHWRTIRSAYGKAPYFEFYAHDFERVLFAQHELLYDLNYQLLTLCLKCLRANVTIKETLAYTSRPSVGAVDLRNFINSKNHASNRTLYEPVSYPQVFGNMFVTDLSLLDVIFCMGPDALKIVLSGTPRDMNI